MDRSTSVSALLQVRIKVLKTRQRLTFVTPFARTGAIVSNFGASFLADLGFFSVLGADFPVDLRFFVFSVDFSAVPLD